jgi:hypothetical protein
MHIVASTVPGAPIRLAVWVCHDASDQMYNVAMMSSIDLWFPAPVLIRATKLQINNI